MDAMYARRYPAKLDGYKTFFAATNSGKYLFAGHLITCDQHYVQIR
jgi:hypothetical protein